jgi:hypothetical protein
VETTNMSESVAVYPTVILLKPESTGWNIHTPSKRPPSYDSHVFLMFYARYKILAPAEADKAGDDPKKVAQALLDAVNLDSESYRLGHTKACSASRPARLCVLPVFC